MFDERGDGMARYTIFNYQRDPVTGQYQYKVSEQRRGSVAVPLRPARVLFTADKRVKNSVMKASFCSALNIVRIEPQSAAKDVVSNGLFGA